MVTRPNDVMIQPPRRRLPDFDTFRLTRGKEKPPFPVCYERHPHPVGAWGPLDIIDRAGVQVDSEEARLLPACDHEGFVGREETETLDTAIIDPETTNGLPIAVSQTVIQPGGL